MSLQDSINEAITYIRKRGGQCAVNPTFEDIDKAISLAQGRIKQALSIGKFCNGQSELVKKLTDANERLQTVSKGISKAKEFCVFINEAEKIAAAVKVLSDDRVIYDNPIGAAQAFDTLFQGIGMICKRLPSPAKEWAQFFENFNLFSKMTPILNPQTNPYHQENWQGANSNQN